jgi:hypothetical protein
MSTFDFEGQKKQFVQKLEAVEKLRLDYEALLKKLTELDIGTLVEQAAKAEIAKLTRYAKTHEIPFTIDVEDLLKQIKLPSVTSVSPAVTHDPRSVLPFIPDTDYEITDQYGDEWRWDGSEWVKNNWNSSGCEWESSNC